MLHIDMNAFFLSLAVEIQVTVIVTLIIGGHPFYLFKRRDALMLLLNSPPPPTIYIKAAAGMSSFDIQNADVDLYLILQISSDTTFP